MILLNVWHYLLVTHGKHTTKINPGLGTKWMYLPNLLLLLGQTTNSVAMGSKMFGITTFTVNFYFMSTQSASI